jgi:signal transduction histidine kinase
MTASLAATQPDQSPSFVRRLRNLFGVRLWASIIFLISSFPIGLALFIIVVVTGATGLGLIITVIGLPLIAFAAFTWRLGAMLERWRVRVLLGLRIPNSYRQVAEGSLFRQTWDRVTDAAVWRDLLYVLLLFPLGIIEFIIAVTLVGVSAGLIFTPLGIYWGQEIVIGTSSLSWQQSLIFVPVGLFSAVAFAAFLQLIANAHRELARMLLGPSGRVELQKQVKTLSRTRTGVVEAMLAERRRIERDLHDGVQQHLVHLAMNLGMAKERIETDPAGAKELVTAAHEEAKRTISDLRNTVRGIHPAVLTDRGLDAAISAVAGNIPIPTTVNVDVNNERFQPIIESTAYFVAAEAMTNIVKHANATEIFVAIRLEGDNLVVEVTDDGKGGADPQNGTGLIGLASRVEALDGTLSISSPAGGPTILKAEIPCA